MVIIGINGYARSGKDSFAAALVERHGFERAAFADALKRFVVAIDPEVAAAVDALGWEEAKAACPFVRPRLQQVGEGARQVIGQNVWVRAAFDRFTPGGRYAISDTRYPNEAAHIVAAGGLVVRVNRPGVGPANGHVSETALDGWPFDLVVDNDGTLDDLAERADELAGQADALAHRATQRRARAA